MLFQIRFIHLMNWHRILKWNNDFSMNFIHRMFEFQRHAFLAFFVLLPIFEALHTHCSIHLSTIGPNWSNVVHLAPFQLLVCDACSCNEHKTMKDVYTSCRIRNTWLIVLSYEFAYTRRDFVHWGTHVNKLDIQKAFLQITKNDNAPKSFIQLKCKISISHFTIFQTEHPTNHFFKTAYFSQNDSQINNTFNQYNSCILVLAIFCKHQNKIEIQRTSIFILIDKQ